MSRIDELSKAVRLEDIDGWLFYGFQHRDPLADEFLGIPRNAVNSRRWLYILHPEPDKSIKISHVIEGSLLHHLPGIQYHYSSLSELNRLLLLFSGLSLAAQVSPELPVFSFLDCGTAELLKKAGIRMVPSGNLIQRIKGVLDPQGIKSHERSAAHLYEIVETCRRGISAALASGKPLYEGTVQGWILDEFEKRGLETNHSPIVASGVRSADPHYAVEGDGFLIATDQVLQLDLWAREKGPQGIYADISWVFYTGAQVPPQVAGVFEAVRGARDGVVEFLNRELPQRTVAGSEADTVGRDSIIESGFEKGLRHRTGHGIDSEVHGYGVNLDAVEFPDSRPFLEGSCFSVEPGVYLEDFGMRTEINVYITENQARISGGPVQQEIVALG